MSTLASIINGGKLPSGTAQAVAGRKADLTAAGTVTADAALIVSEIVKADGASSAGIKLPAGNAGDRYVIVNVGGNTIKLYPPTGGKLNGGSADAAENIATTVTVQATCLDSLDYAVLIGA